MHGANLFPDDLPGFRETVLAYLDAVTAVGHRLVAAIARSLGLEDDWFARYTAEPLVLFRIFNYPAPTPESVGTWGVGEHTDYGLLTLLLQDDNGGLEIKTESGWIDAPPIPGSFVCNIGDMLDRMTRGWYRSTPHRVRASARRDRLSFPLFFDPGFHARVQPIPGLPARADDRASRWDGESVHAFDGTYGEYLVAKVSRVFPQLSGGLSGTPSSAPPRPRP
jgi:polar amino acid transport system ATP-binding protein